MNVNLPLLLAQISGMFVVFAAALFLAAGTVFWLPGWVFLVLFFSFVAAISLWLLGHNPSLLIERMTGTFKADQKVWDKVFFMLANVAFLAWLVVMPFDARRFHWSLMPVWLQVVGGILLLCSFYLFFLVFCENSYLSPAVRIQEERQQKVVSTGPYRYVRHPMYSALLLFVPGTTLLLGSWWGVVPGAVLVGMVARRAVLEERVLRDELEGYDEYMERVRFRLIPGVW